MKRYAINLPIVLSSIQPDDGGDYVRHEDAMKRIKELEKAVEWYSEKASALVRYTKEKKPDAIEAVIVELSLDNGSRGEALLKSKENDMAVTYTEGEHSLLLDGLKHQNKRIKELEDDNKKLRLKVSAANRFVILSPCKDCGKPVNQGYCCSFCGSVDP